MIKKIFKSTFLYVLVLLLLSCNTTSAQIDSIIKTPKSAAIRSALIPGWGQLYNEKKWKAPIVWAALGTSTFFIYTNAQQYNYYRKTYVKARNSGIAVVIDNQPLSSGDLLLYKNYYRRNLDLSVILTALVYSLNIVDALVDGHLRKFDVSDTLNITPTTLLDYRGKPIPAVGISLAIR